MWRANLAADDLDYSGSQSTGTLEFVARHDDGCPGGGRVAQGGVEFVAGGSVEAGVGFVKQPQFGASGNQTGQRCAALLSSRQATDCNIGEALSEAHALQRRLHLGLTCANGCTPKAHVFTNGEIGIQTVGMAEQANPAAHCLTLSAQIATQQHGLATRQRQQPSAQTQQGGFTGTIGSLQQHNLPAVHGEVDPSQYGKLTEDCNCVGKVHDRIHEARPR